jgi:hypothetical protein
MSNRGSNNMARTAVEARPSAQELRQRGTGAIEELSAALRLPTGSPTLLNTVLALAAAEEIRHNPTFASRIQRLHLELGGGQAGGTRGGTKKQPKEPLIALRHTGKDIDPYAPPDPADLKYVYGDDKLARALDDYSLEKLKKTSAKIEAAHPGTRPKNKSSKQSVIDYIVQFS